MINKRYKLCEHKREERLIKSLNEFLKEEEQKQKNVKVAVEQKEYLRFQKGKQIIDEELGGVSAPMSTLSNTPGVGSAQPAQMAATTGAEQASPEAIGSGDLWGDSPSAPKKKKRKVTKRKKKNTKKRKNKVNEGLGYVKYDNDRYEIIEEEPNRIKIRPLRNPYGGPRLSSPMYHPSFWVATDDTRLERLSENIDEMNINPHDKIGVMMAKKMGVPLCFEKGKGAKDVKQKITGNNKSHEIMDYDEYANLLKEKNNKKS